MSTSLLDNFFSGNRQALARIITLLENDADRRVSLSQTLYPKSGQSRRIGFTGPPGVGKSTLINRLVQLLREHDQTVGVVAVDPTSPFTGGALLGDRLRMQSSWSDPGVFMRSMAERTSTSGLSAATPDVITALDAFGKDVIIVETVGVGQSTLDIAEVTDTTVVVLSPESGDSIQAMKAGLMEIADILVVNKDDRAGSGHFASDLQMVLEMKQNMGDWLPPIVRTSAQNGTGIEEVHTRLIEHQGYLDDSGTLEARRLRQSRSAITRAIDERIACRLRLLIPDLEVLSHLAGRVSKRELTPFTAADEVLKETDL